MSFEQSTFRNGARYLKLKANLVSVDGTEVKSREGEISDFLTHPP